MNTSQTINFDIPIEEVDIPMENWSQFDNYEFQINEIFVDIYPPQAAEWCDENGCHIEELDPNEEGKRVFKIVKNPEPTAEEIAQFNAMLSLTAADVERGIYKAKGMDFDDVIALVESYNEAVPLDAEGNPTGVDIKALKIELKANNFYYGNPYVKQIGQLLGFTEAQMLEFFKTKDYTALLS